MEDTRGNKIRKLMTFNLYREGVFQIYCGHWFWAVEKKVGYMIDNMLFSYEQNKLIEGRMSSSMISGSKLYNTVFDVTEILMSIK